MIAGIGDLDPACIKDKTVPWPAKAYYLLANSSFHLRLMAELDDARQFLNYEVRGFLDNPRM